MTLAPALLSLTLTFAQVPAPHAAITPADDPPTSSTSPHREQLLTRAFRLELAGACVLVASGAFWGLMISGLAFGRRSARTYNAIVADADAAQRPTTPEERDHLAIERSFGRATNAYAIAGGLTAGALTVLGAALLGRAALIGRDARRLTPLVHPRGLGLRLQF